MRVARALDDGPALNGSFTVDDAGARFTGAERLIARDHPEHVVIVPGFCGLRRLLHLGKIHVVNQPAVFPQPAVLDIEVVDRPLTLGEQVENLPPPRFGDGVEGIRGGRGPRARGRG